jgi:enterochelin esterase-like enzyme
VQFDMSSETSSIYPGLNGPYTRKVWVYVPKQYVDGTAAPFMIVQDGHGYVPTLLPVLDNMIQEGRLPIMLAVLIDSGGGDGRGSERGLEYDRVSEDYSKFVETEVLPIIPKDATIQKTYKNLKFTTDPEGRATMGGSSGGAAAFTMAWFRPDLYRRVLTYSGTFVNQYPEPAYPHGAWEYHENLIPKNNPKPIRAFLEVGQNDNNLDAKFGDGMHDWVTANQNMASVMKAKGYHYRFVYAASAGHVDGRVVRQTLPKALDWLWRGYCLN